MRNHMVSLADFKSQLTEAGLVKWRHKPALESLWCFKMKAEAGQIWEYISDTSRFNRELGFNPRVQSEKNGRLVVSTRMAGFRQEWIEEPWTWVVNRTISSVREYTHGMAKSVFSVFHIDSESSDDHRLVYIYFGWTPKNAFWAWFLGSTERIMEKKFGDNFRKIDAHIATIVLSKQKALGQSPPQVSSAVNEKIELMAAGLKERKQDVGAVERLIDFVKTADDLEAESIRVIPLSRKWGIDQVDLLKTCLHSTQLGLLKISWDVICPHCRGSRYSAGSLGDIPEMANCGICDIDFSTSDENSIEVLFHIHESIRTVEEQMFCAAEPAKKNHIKIQASIAPGETFSVKSEFAQGHYRVRALGVGGEARLELSEQFSQAIYHHAHRTEHNKLNPRFELIYKNESDHAIGFVFEELWWDQNALRPAQVLALTDFRDLFSEDHLNSNVKLFLGDQTILFTDIVGSTNFYANVGDAKAFADVRAHFQEVYQCVAAHQGVVVKTIGDAVMAAFPSTSLAVAAAISVQNQFAHDRQDTSLRLRISVHAGPVIAVRLNTGLDYFGNTVNIAAKIQSCAGAGEIALSESVYKMLVSQRSLEYPVTIRHNKRDGADITQVHVLNVSGIARPVAAA